MKSATLRIDYSFFVCCPECGYRIDLSDESYNFDNRFSKPIFSNKWEDLKGEEVKCYDCPAEFKIGSIEPN